jgi:hypothetical protein
MTGRRGLRLILASQALDGAYARLDRLRSRLVLALASDDTLERFNEWTYARAERYAPDSPGFQRQLYPWEDHVIATFFPRPPARLLVGGAGAGREALALAERGYEVVAFEPVHPLATAMARVILADGKAGRVRALRGGYGDLPHLAGADDPSRVEVTGLGPFDAAIVGWGSFSHLRTEALRLHTLRAFGALTAGPILVSFIVVKPPAAASSPRGSSVRRGMLTGLIRRRGRDPDDRFSMRTGYQHPVSEDEVAALAELAGLAVMELQFAGAETYAPYAVLKRR